ncbi:MAG: hypothetical protein ACYS14_07075 [Planctomycetota bacterium]
MKLSKRQKSGLVVLAILSLALVIDRALLGGVGVPVGASASSTEAQAEPVAEAKDTADPKPEPAPIEFAQRLESAWSQKGLGTSQARDVFSLPASWFDDVRPPTPVDSPQDAVTLFAANHQLRGVLATGQARCVTVDDRVLRLGDEFDGFKLVTIEDDYVTFEAGGRQVILRLATDR